MSNVLVVAEHFDGKLRSATLPTITFAQEAAELTEGEVIVLVLADDAGPIAAEAAKYGVSKVLAYSSPMFANYLAENYAAAIAEIAEDHDVAIIAAPSSTTGKDFLPRAAALLDAGFVGDAIEVFEDDDEGEIAYKRPIWAGNLIARVISDADVTCVTVRTTAFEAAEEDGDADVEEVSAGVEASTKATFLKYDQVKSDRPDLTDAPVVIAGGRGLKSAEAFKMLEELADLTGGALGASRAAVDSGYAPNDWQIGQTGKIVAPNLYIGVAISGAIQHLAGMKASKTIVAINTNAEAPIFQITDYGLVADAFQAVPALIEKLKE